MILVDTSVWIALLNGRIAPVPTGVPGDLVTCGPVVPEALRARGKYVPVWHRDRDFDKIAKFTGLQVVSEKSN